MVKTFTYTVTKDGTTVDELHVPWYNDDPDVTAIEMFYNKGYKENEYELKDDMGYDVLPTLKLRR